MTKKILIALLAVVAAIGVYSVASPLNAASQANDNVSQTNDNMEEMRKINPDDAVVELKTTLGDIYVELFNDTPLHRDNFLKLVKDGFYEGVLFHRVIDSFMVQAGDPGSKDAAQGQRRGAGDPGYTIEAEIDYPKHFHKYGALAAARTGDAMNPERRSSGSQFYIVTGQKYSERQLESMGSSKVSQKRQAYFQNLAMQYRDSIQAMQQAGNQEGLEALRQKLIAETEESVKGEELPAEVKQAYVEKGGTPHLDGQYTVYGEVIKGMDVVEKIQKVETDASDRPKEDIRIISAKIIESEKN